MLKNLNFPQSLTENEKRAGQMLSRDLEVVLN